MGKGRVTPLKEAKVCFFCGELITKRGQEGDCLHVHSLDLNHNNMAPENKVPTHNRCHESYHNEGLNNPMFDKHHTNETRRKLREISKDWWTQLTPTERVEHSRKMSLAKKKWWTNMTPKERLEWGRKISEGMRRR